MSLSRDPETPEKVPLKDPNGHVLGCVENGILTIRVGDRRGDWHIGHLIEIAMLQLSLQRDIIDTG